MKPVILSPKDDIEQFLITGARIFLRPGRYKQYFTIRQSNITIKSLDPAKPAEFWRNCVDIHGSSKVKFEGLVFRQSPSNAIRVMGKSQEVSISHCQFLACGVQTSSLTVWLGEDVHHAKVEKCLFDLQSACSRIHLRPNLHCYSIAIMCAEERSTHHHILNNVIRLYSYGIQLGASGTSETKGFHLVKGNRVEYPWADGIHIKHAQCTVEGNVVHAANKYSISARAGHHSRFIRNIITDGYVGISLRGIGHQVVGNRFERMRRAAIVLQDAKANGDGFAAKNTMIHKNSFISCGGADFNPLTSQPCGGILSCTREKQRIKGNKLQGGGEMIIDGKDYIQH